MLFDWLWTSWSEAGLIALSALLMVAVVIVVIRIAGLRSLSKMSSFDFAVTVAIGSIMATGVVTATPVANAAIGVAALLSVQAIVALLRRHAGFGKVVDNSPMLLMRNGTFHSEALAECRVTRDDVIAKLREANVLDLDEVRAVVLETTGDISVLHGRDSIDPVLLEDVRTRA